jgi:N-acetyl-alpha-D-muramate 1-phosphate uridylyltransferase
MHVHKITAEKLPAAWVDVGTPERLAHLDAQIRDGFYA